MLRDKMKTQLPNLSSLLLHYSATPRRGIRDMWLEACGERPAFKSWSSMRAKDKREMLHDVAAKADDDTEPDGNYLTAYEQLDIDDLTSNNWSVEHVVPRSHIHGRQLAKNDPVGWIEATRSANSRRSNYPLYLWTDTDGTIALPNTLVRVDDELHYVPPEEQRGRLARKWLFIRASYLGIQPPTTAQCKRAAYIVALAQHDPIHSAERRLNEDYRNMYGWANPLLEDDANQWYSNAEWRALVFA